MDVVQVDLLVGHGGVLLMSRWRCCALLYNNTMDWMDMMQMGWRFHGPEHGFGVDS